ncbi:homeobox protein Hox-B4 isoform 3-T3 [Cyanocitta cristata]
MLGGPGRARAGQVSLSGARRAPRHWPALSHGLNFVHLTKLMAMSSFLINSNYVDPKFPPCEEYSHSDYLPNHSPEYYGSQRRESTFQHEAMYEPRSACKEQLYSSCQSSGHPAAVLSPRGHVHPPAGLQSHLSEPSQPREPGTPSPPPSCSQNSASQSPPGSSCKEPVVYPWMKKVHVSTANLRRPSVGKKAPGVLQETFRANNNNNNNNNIPNKICTLKGRAFLLGGEKPKIQQHPPTPRATPLPQSSLTLEETTPSMRALEKGCGSEPVANPHRPDPAFLLLLGVLARSLAALLLSQNPPRPRICRSGPRRIGLSA